MKILSALLLSASVSSSVFAANNTANQTIGFVNATNLPLSISYRLCPEGPNNEDRYAGRDAVMEGDFSKCGPVLSQLINSAKDATVKNANLFTLHADGQFAALIQVENSNGVTKNSNGSALTFYPYNPYNPGDFYDDIVFQDFGTTKIYFKSYEKGLSA